MMRCYYEILEVAETATNDELKKAYRKLALKCHPDKNPGREIVANEEFKEVCQAYSTLTDPQERAFYDRNKESILRGAGNNDGRPAEELDVFKYFSTSCFPGGYTDALNGFYTVYRNLFYELSMKDMKYMTEEEPEIPTFGDSGADLEDVAVFYGYWSSYCTSMPFAWADQIDVRQAPCRWVEKKIDRENRKFRDQEKKQFNERIRNLVLFVKKRDPRWKERVRLVEQRSADAAARREQRQERLREERQRQLQQDIQDETLAAAKREYLQQLRTMESQMRGSGGDDLANFSANDDSSGGSQAGESHEEEEEEDDLICVACVKMFSSERTMELHMNTKKHKMKVAQMLREEQAGGDEKEVEERAADLPDEDAFGCTNEVQVDASEHDDDMDSCTPRTSQSKKEKKKKKLEKKLQKGRPHQMNASDESLKQQDNAPQEETLHTKVEELKLGDDIPARIEPGENQNISSADDNLMNAPRLDGPSSSMNESMNNKATTVQPKVNTHPKKQIKRNSTKGAASVNCVPDDSNTDSIEAICQVCNSQFPSKNKLFQHIKASGHAVLKDGTSSNKKGKSKRK